jgi:hypothetical protein
MWPVKKKEKKKNGGALIAILIGLGAAYIFSNAAPPSTSVDFRQCVISRESSGNPQVRNGSHWGLYQFQLSTWEEYGGSASSFGNANATEQTQIFNNAIAHNGQYNWSPYDGC